MLATKVLHTLLVSALPQVHQDRMTAVLAAVGGLVRGTTLSLTAIGRHLGGAARVKHAIKRIDRLLGNDTLHAERMLFYGALARTLIGTQPHPVLLIDDSDVDPARTRFIMRAALPVGGRALPIYEEVHTRQPTRRLRKHFLNRLAALLPEACRPILVTDAGLRSPWFIAVEQRDWYYVGRVRNRDFACYPGRQEWFPAKALYRLASAVPKALGALSLVRSRPFHTHAYLYRSPKKYRHDRTLNGTLSRAARSRKYAQRAREPWLLVSNLPQSFTHAKRVVALYRLRMQIEEGFRDLKSPRTGFAFRHSGTRHPRRIEVLLLIAALAAYLCVALGQSLRQRGEHRAYQANTVTNRPVLSLFFLGMQLLVRGGCIALEEFRAAVEQIKIAVQTQAFVET